MKLGDQDKPLARHRVCFICVEELRQWIQEQKAIILSNIPSALRPVLHGPGKPVPSPPDTVENIFYSDTEYECEIDDDFDEVYDSISDETKLFTQSETLVRDLNLPTDSAEVLGFRLKEKYFLAPAETENNITLRKNGQSERQLDPGVKVNQRENLVDPKKVLLPPLHIKLGLMKHFVKALPKEGECFEYLCDQFPGSKIEGRCVCRTRHQENDER
ncbi:hypothetical protein AVEN_222905-1 [Araneus ventricosus]|uniref:Uncharacterized protein n=1 Tax=Araneus ventricosus TaxID=182803 RepID=A0A4Y2WT96_ARAVE|nr:hypothetical protein AVEN_222905-1 [Araneus ventricosus]